MTAIEDLFADFGIEGGLFDVLVSTSLFLLTLVIIYVVGRSLIIPGFRRLLIARNVGVHARRPLLKLTWLTLIFGGFIIAAGVAGYGNILRSLATIAAAATLAVGFAMQNVIRNFVAGIFIFTDRPFKIGDWIKWEDNEGIVRDISLRVTRVESFDNELLTVPNSHLTENVVTNPVANNLLRLNYLFGIHYDADIHEATEIIIEEAGEHPDILDEPAPSVRLVELADSSVGLRARVWIENPTRSDFTKTRGEFVTAVKERFDEAGIVIPFPQRDLSGTIDIAGDQAT